MKQEYINANVCLHTPQSVLFKTNLQSKLKTARLKAVEHSVHRNLTQIQLQLLIIRYNVF